MNSFGRRDFSQCLLNSEINNDGCPITSSDFYLALIRTCAFVHLGNYFHLFKKNENHCKTQQIPSAVSTEVSSLPWAVCNARGSGEQSPCCGPLTLFQTLLTPGIWSSLVSTSLAETGMETTKKESSWMWKCWCPNQWKNRTAKNPKLIIYLFLIGVWQNSYKSEMGC